MFTLRNSGVLAAGAVLFMLSACGNAPDESTEQHELTQKKPTEDEEQPQKQEEPKEGMPPTSLEAAAAVMAILKDGDMGKLASWVHPKTGVRFSPYAYVDKETDLVFSKDELQNLMEDSTLYVWRSFPGSGELIEMAYSDYFKKFVYDAEFIKDGEISLNEEIGEGSMVNNLNEVYPEDNHDFVEYHIDGIDPKTDGMDWRSLRLVFEKIGDDRALVGIIHDKWTP